MELYTGLNWYRPNDSASWQSSRHLDIIQPNHNSPRCLNIRECTMRLIADDASGIGAPTLIANNFSLYLIFSLKSP